jgi:hypothetical protein
LLPTNNMYFFDYVNLKRLRVHLDTMVTQEERAIENCKKEVQKLKNSKEAGVFEIVWGAIPAHLARKGSFRNWGVTLDRLIKQIEKEQPSIVEEYQKHREEFASIEM